MVKASDKTRVDCEQAWARALAHCEKELGEQDYNLIRGVESPDQLAEALKTLETQASDISIVRRITSMKPHLDRLNTFVTFLLVGIGGNNISAAFLWGAASLLIQLACTSQDTIEEISDLIDDLGNGLKQFQMSYKSVELDSDHYEFFFNLVVDFVLNSVEVIRHLRQFADEGGSPLTAHAWSNVHKGFKDTLKKLNSEVHQLLQLTDRQIIDSMKRQIDELTLRKEKPEEPVGPVLPCRTIPFARNEFFHGRKTILDDIQNALDENNDKEHDIHSIAIWGAGGIGKTQIALEYAHRRVKDHKDQVVLWIGSETVEQMRTAFNQAADLLKVPGFKEENPTIRNQELLFQWLGSTDVSWLLVFDNVERSELLKQNMPPLGRGRILVTCRSETVAASIARSSEVLAFTPPEGGELMSKILRRSEFGEDEASAAEQLTKTLGGLPLAIVLITQRIFRRKKRVRDFISYFEKNRKKLKVKAEDESGHHYEKDLATVWKAAFDDVPCNSNTGMFLSLLCFFAPDAIPDNLLLLEEDDEVSVGEKWGFLHDESEIDDAKADLVGRSLIRFNEHTQMTSIHRLIQLGYLDEMNLPERIDAFETAFCLLRFRFPRRGRGHLYTRWRTCAPLVMHVLSLQDRYKELRKEKYSFGDESYVLLMTDAFWYLLETAQWLSAERLLVTTSELNGDKKSFNQGEIYQGLASLKVRSGECRAALELYAKVLDIRRPLVPPDSNHLANALSSMGFTTTAMYRFEDASKYFGEVFACFNGKDDTTLRRSYNIDRFLRNRGRLYFYQRDYENARKDFALADEHQDIMHGSNSHYHGETAYMLGKMFAREGKLDEALDRLNFAYDCMSKGKETHLSVMAVRYQQGCIHLHQGRYEDAYTRLIDALQLCKINRPNKDDRRDMARVQWRLSQTLEKQGSSFSARELQKEAEEAKKKLTDSGLYPDPTGMDEEEQWDCFLGLLYR